MTKAIQHFPARRGGKTIETVAAILSGPSGGSIRMRALNAANAERVARNLPPMRWAEMSAAGQMHFVSQVVSLPAIEAHAAAQKSAAEPTPCCARCGVRGETRPYHRRDIGERQFCSACAAFLTDELEAVPAAPLLIIDEFADFPPPPPVDEDADTGRPWCEYCGEAEPLQPVFTNGVGWRYVCADCADFLNGDAPDDAGCAQPLPHP